MAQTREQQRFSVRIAGIRTAVSSPRFGRYRVATETDPRQIQLAPALRSLIGRISRRLRPTQAGAGLTPH